VQGIGSATNFGGYLSIFSGLVYDATARHHRWGPRFTLSIAALLNFLGYMALWAAATGCARLLLRRARLSTAPETNALLPFNRKLGVDNKA
jgi:hypothetical protein